MRTLNSLLFGALVIALTRGATGEIRQSNQEFDTLYIKLPVAYDTVDVRMNNPAIKAAIFDKYSQKDYRAPQGLSLDIQRHASFKIKNSIVPVKIESHIIDIPIMSDSLRISRGAFLHRHQFFVIFFQNDSVYFHKARGEYLTKVQ